MSKKNPDRTIIQIIPAEPGWDVYYEHGGDKTAVFRAYWPVAMWALVEEAGEQTIEPVCISDGTVRPLGEYVDLMYRTHDADDTFIVNWNITRS